MIDPPPSATQLTTRARVEPAHFFSDNLLPLPSSSELLATVAWTAPISFPSLLCSEIFLLTFESTTLFAFLFLPQALGPGRSRGESIVRRYAPFGKVASFSSLFFARSYSPPRRPLKKSMLFFLRFRIPSAFFCPLGFLVGRSRSRIFPPGES